MRSVRAHFRSSVFTLIVGCVSNTFLRNKQFVYFAWFNAGYVWSFRWAVVIMIMICVAARAGQGLDSIELALHGDMVLEDAGIQIPSPPSLSPSGSFSNSGALGVDLNSDPGFGNSDPSGSSADVLNVVGIGEKGGLQHRTGAGGTSGARTIILSPSGTVANDTANNTTTSSGSGSGVTEAKKTV